MIIKFKTPSNVPLDSGWMTEVVSQRVGVPLKSIAVTLIEYGMQKLTWEMRVTHHAAVMRELGLDAAAELERRLFRPEEPVLQA